MITPHEKLQLGHCIENLILKARGEEDPKRLEELSFTLREAASRIDGLASGLKKYERR